MKHLQKFQMVVLAICMFFAVNVQAANKWDGTVAAGFASGSGTSTNPYIVSNEPEFAYLLQQIAYGNNFSGKYVKQIRDLDLTNVTLSVSNTFAGDYNGNGCAIVMKSKLFETVSGSIHNVRVYSDNVCPIAETLSYGYIYNIYRFSTRPFASSATSALVVNTNNGYIYNSFVDTDGNTGSDGQKAISVALKNTGRIENCVNNITNDEWGSSNDWDNQSYLAYDNIGSISYCYSNGNVCVTCTNGTIMYTHCYGWMPTGTYTGCTSSGYWDTVGRTPIYMSYVSSLNSWVSNNNVREYSAWVTGKIPLYAIQPDSYQVEYWDQYFDYTLIKNMAYSSSIGDMPIPQGDAEFLGWYYNGTKVTSESKFDYGVTLNAQWKWNIRTQPSHDSMTVEVDDEAHALYQWKRYTKFTNFEDWKSDNQGVGGSTSSKTYKFDALAGDTLKFTYSLSSEAYDKFNVKLNNVELINIGGNQTNSFKFNIETAGSYELVMSYKKDASGNAGLDGVEVMDISVSNAVQNIEGATSRTLTQYELTGTNGYCCEVKYTNNPTVLTSNIVTVSAHRVLYYVNGELYHSDVVREGETFCLAEGPAEDGYEFSGWAGLPENLTMSTKDIIANATFKPVADTDISDIANTIYFDNCEAFCGKTIELPVKMKNNISVTGFQFDIVLPEGVSVVQDEDGFNDITLSTERTTAAKTNTFDSSCMSDGSIRVLAASTRNYAFSGTDGEVCIIKLQIAEDLPGDDYPIILKNIELTNASGQTWNVDRLKRTITVKDYQLGDANGDGRVSVGDFSAIASHILGSTPEGFNLGAADANQDNNISVGDLSAVATMILTEEAGSGASKVKAKAPEVVSDPNNYIYADPVTISADGDATIVFNMKNAIAATGFQFNFKLPEGFYVTEDEDGFLDVFLSQTRTTSRRTNTFDCVKWSDGSYRVLAASTKNYEFSGNDGEVVTVHIQKDDAVESGDYKFVLTDIELTDAQGGTFRTSRSTYTISVPSNSTDYALVDGENYSNATTTTYDALTFTKTFSASTVGNWNAFYVPMSIDVEEYTGELDFAEIYAFCATVDTNGDGTVNADDENFLFVRPVMTGCTEANVPYLVRPHEAKTYTINSADNILHKAENGYVEFSTTLDKFTVTGLNEAYTVVAGDNNYYVSASGKLNYRTTGSTSVKANRWIMHRESKKYGSNGNTASEAKEYRIVALGEEMDEADVIRMIGMSVMDVRANDDIYTIDGMKVNGMGGLQKGIYIKRGKKYIVK